MCAYWRKGRGEELAGTGKGAERMHEIQQPRRGYGAAVAPQVGGGAPAGQAAQAAEEAGAAVPQRPWPAQPMSREGWDAGAYPIEATQPVSQSDWADETRQNEPCQPMSQDDWEVEAHPVRAAQPTNQEGWKVEAHRIGAAQPMSQEDWEAEAHRIWVAQPMSREDWAAETHWIEFAQPGGEAHGDVAPARIGDAEPTLYASSLPPPVAPSLAPPPASVPFAPPSAPTPLPGAPPLAQPLAAPLAPHLRPPPFELGAHLLSRSFPAAEFYPAELRPMMARHRLRRRRHRTAASMLTGAALAFGISALRPWAALMPGSAPARDPTAPTARVHTLGMPTSISVSHVPEA